MIRNLLLDWSGTLVDDLPAVLLATNAVLRRAGRAEMSLDQFRREFCLPFKKFYDRHTPGTPLPQLETWFHAALRRARCPVVELPHAREFLEFSRRRRLRCFLLSSVHERHFRSQCQTNGFQEFFERAYTGVMDKTKKIREVLVENQLRPEETLMVGDMAHDVAAAHRGGVASCAVLTGYNTLPQLRRATPDLIVEHLGELQRRLAGPDFEPAAAIASAQRPPLATVGALIFNACGDMLLIRTHKWSNLWGIPGGKIKWGETALAALRREIREETALKITDIRFVLVQDCIHSPEFYHDAHFVLLNYTCRCRELKPKVVLNDEGREFRWLDAAAARQLPLNTPTRILLDAVAPPDSLTATGRAKNPARAAAAKHRPAKRGRHA